MSYGESEAVRVRGEAMNGTEVIESEVKIGGGYRVASVFKHLQHGSPRTIVPVTLYTSIVDVPTQAFPQSRLVHVPYSTSIGLHLSRSLALVTVEVQ